MALTSVPGGHIEVVSSRWPIPEIKRKVRSCYMLRWRGPSKKDRGATAGGRVSNLNGSIGCSVIKPLLQCPRMPTARSMKSRYIVAISITLSIGSWAFWGNTMTNKSDVLIIGSGIAGLRLALALPDSTQITILTKRELISSNTRWAQGGIAAAWRDDDSWQDHVKDTLVAGAGLCRREIVEYVARQAKARVEELIELGVNFDRDVTDSDSYSLHREGAPARRICISKISLGRSCAPIGACQTQCHGVNTLARFHSPTMAVSEPRPPPVR